MEKPPEEKAGNQGESSVLMVPALTKPLLSNTDKKQEQSCERKVPKKETEVQMLLIYNASFYCFICSDVVTVEIRKTPA